MTIPDTQLAYGFKFGKKTIQKYDNWPVLRPGAGEVLVKVEAAGLCQSDLHILYAQEKHVPKEFVMGHEIAGQIVEVGKEGVPNQYKVGLRVAVSIANYCGICENCRSGADNNCLNSRTAYGLSMNGGFQQYLLVKNLKGLIPIPENVSYEDAAVASDAVLTPFHAIQNAREGLLPTSKVLVVGLGGLGLNAIQILHNFGCHIVAVDVKKDSEDLAKKFGAAEFYQDLTLSNHPKESFDVCFDFCGLQETFDLCEAYTKQRGIILPVGLGRYKLTVRHYELARREIKILYSFGGTTLESVECMKWISEGRIKPVTTSVPMEELPNYLLKLAKGVIRGRVVFQPPKL
ncbi:uncharacterized protein PRCAT00001383001 [Priceomyces carsonii]|uniref:uncharacterized protein n=1 Tax=Priceomyces carsonii TaxID=28549 RepID=UPI002ED799E0|nr:unnamed protein product [Priceomyces carsonii]